jgi:hypothetical protein
MLNRAAEKLEDFHDRLSVLEREGVTMPFETLLREIGVTDEDLIAGLAKLRNAAP